MAARRLADRIACQGLRGLGAEGVASQKQRVGVPRSVEKPPGLLGGTVGPSAAVLARLTEREFQAMVRAGLEQRGYLVYHVPDMRKTTAGLPDLLFWHPKRPGRFWFWELKRQRDAVISPEQQRVIDHLAAIDGIDARIVKPSDWLTLKEEV